jgi:hypothetical protein
MSEAQYFEVECAVFRKHAGAPLEVFVNQTGEWKPYEGDEGRVLRMSNPMSLEEVRPYMDRDPVEEGTKEAV